MHGTAMLPKPNAQSQRRAALQVNVLCQITSQNSSKAPFAIPIDSANFDNGGLPVASNFRPNRIFTVDKNMIVRTACHVSGSIYRQVFETVVALIRP